MTYVQFKEAQLTTQLFSFPYHIVSYFPYLIPMIAIKVTAIATITVHIIIPKPM